MRFWVFEPTGFLDQKKKKPNDFRDKNFRLNQKHPLSLSLSNTPKHKTPQKTKTKTPQKTTTQKKKQKMGGKKDLLSSILAK